MPLSRRHALACACLAPFAGARAQGHHGPRSTLTPQAALERLMQGNARFVADAPQPAPPRTERRRMLVAGQQPFAAILGCSDSRAVPEIVFEADLGEIFTVRVAGNALANAELGTLEYASAALGVPLILVLGHQGCGAVSAAVEVAERGATLPYALATLINAILPSVAEARRGNPVNLVDAAVRIHARRTAQLIAGGASPGIRERVQAGEIMVRAAYYDLSEGRVALLDA